MDISQVTHEQRKQLLKSHPVVTKKYLIITPVITNVYALIRDRVFMRTTGTFLYATPRMGKTTCAKATKILLEAESPQLFVMSFIAEPHKKQEAALLIDILESDKIGIPKSARYKPLQRMLLRHILSNLEMREGQQFVLMIDEMQNLGEEEFQALATIHNRLEALGVRMTTLGFGQPEILNTRNIMLHTTSQHFLIARFLSEPIPFDGCASQEDLEKILYAYDEEQYYPEDSDYSFTRFFLPDAFDNGFRLSSYAKPIWSVLRKATNTESLPMEHLSRTIEFLLVASQREDSRDFKFTQQQIKTAVQASNLQYFSGLMDRTSQQ